MTFDDEYGRGSQRRFSTKLGSTWLIVLRKNLSVEKGQQRLFDDYHYFFYLTNDWQSTPAELVLRANQRCNQENLHAQLLSGVRALRAPVDDLESNWAYMVMTALAWNLKA